MIMLFSQICPLMSILRIYFEIGRKIEDYRIDLAFHFFLLTLISMAQVSWFEFYLQEHNITLNH